MKQTRKQKKVFKKKILQVQCLIAFFKNNSSRKMKRFNELMIFQAMMKMAKLILKKFIKKYKNHLF